MSKCVTVFMCFGFMTPYAPRYRRLGALMYDALLITAIVFCGTSLAHLIYKNDLKSTHWLFQTYLLLIAGLYLVYSWYKTGQTLGMKAWGIQLVSASDKLTMRQAVLRYLLAVVGFWAGGLGFLWCLIDSKKQTLADRGSKTLCLYVGKLAYSPHKH